jgi:DNA-binding LacI/PurR family transcriptional regulator
MIRTLAVNCAPFLDCSQDAGKTAAETASDEMAIGAVQALCELSVLVNQQKYIDLPLAALDDALKRYYNKKGAFRDRKMAKSAKATVDELLGRESHHLQAQKIHRIHAAMELQLDWAERGTTSKRRQFQVRLRRA